MRNYIKSKLVFAGVGLLLVEGAGGQTLEELAKRLEKLEGKVAAYERRFGPIESGSGYQNAVVAESSVQSSKKSGGAMSGADEIDNYYKSSGGSASLLNSGTSFGGYGELHLNLGDKEEVDFHRWVLFLRHKFNDKITLYSELELEHALSGEGKNGEVELEQAYIDFALDEGLHAKAGLFLVPVGSLNEVHEPDTFFGTERNPIEKNIIPTTWWEAGLGLSQSLDNGLGWDLALHSGLNVPTSSYKIRSGRQKVSNAPANEPAVTGRLRYSPMAGLDFSAFGQYQNDITQGDALNEDNSAMLFGGAASWRYGGFGLKGLVAYWDISGETPKSLDANEQWGYYIEPSYTWNLRDDSKFGVFARYNSYKDASGESEQFDVGMNYWPIDNVVFKADFSHLEPESGEETETFNFGVGYSF